MLRDKRTTRISAAFVHPKGWCEGQIADLRISASTHVRYCSRLWVFLSIWSYFTRKLQEPKHVFSQ